MGVQQDHHGRSPRSSSNKREVKSEAVRSVEGIVKDYLALVAKDYIANDVTESYRIVKKKRLKRSDEVRVDLSHCKYEVMRTVIHKLGWQEAIDDPRPSHLYWTDTSIGPERLMALRHGQKVNHFFGMLQICRKKSLARHLSTMRKMFPAEYRFFPRAYILPNQLQEFLTRFSGPKQRTYILKPDSGSQGKGVALVQNISDVKQAIGGFSGANMLAQKYLTNPMLINGYKFDLRIYTLILSCEPLRVYLYREGLVRFCTMKYMKPTRDNLRHSCMHLTNYSLNKFSPNFEYSDTEMDKGSKWSLSGLYRALAARGYDTKKLKRQIKKLVVSTFIAIAPYLAHNYNTCVNEDDNGRSCFEVLGLDILIDDKCKPWLLEVNHSPSFSIDTPLDLKVKEALLSDTLSLIHIDPTCLSKISMTDKKNSKMRLYGKERKETCEEQKEVKLPTKEMEQYEAEHIGNFDLIYPCEDENLQSLYDICLAGAQEAFKHSFDMKVKKAIEKVQEERRQEILDRELEEKKKLKQRAQLRKRAQESARQVALSRQLSDVTESEDGPKSARAEGEEEQMIEDGTESLDIKLLHKQLDWNPPPASLINSPRETPRKDVKLSPRCLPTLPSASDKKVAWEKTLRNESPYGNSGFIRPQIGLLPPIRQAISQADTFSQTSPRLKLFEAGKQAVSTKQEKEFTAASEYCFWQNDGNSSSYSCGKIDEEAQVSISNSSSNNNNSSSSSSSPGKRRLPDVRGRNRSISPDNCLVPLRTLPTARFIFDEPVLSSSRTEPPRAPESVTKWYPKLQLNEPKNSSSSSSSNSIGKDLMVKEVKLDPPPTATCLHVCHICKPVKRIPRYEACRSRKPLRDYLSAAPAEVMGGKPAGGGVETGWKTSSDSLLLPKERVVNAFVTQTDPNRFLTLAKSLHRS